MIEASHISIRFEPGIHKIDDSARSNLEMGIFPSSGWSPDTIGRVMHNPTSVMGIDGLMPGSISQESGQELAWHWGRSASFAYSALPGEVERITGGQDELTVVFGDMAPPEGNSLNLALHRWATLATLGLTAQLLREKNRESIKLKTETSQESQGITRRKFLKFLSAGGAAIGAAVALPAVDLGLEMTAVSDIPIAEWAQRIIRNDPTRDTQILGFSEVDRAYLDGRTALVAQKTADVAARQEVDNATVLFGYTHLPGSEVAIKQERRDEAILNLANYVFLHMYKQDKSGTIDQLVRDTYSQLSEVSVAVARPMDADLLKVDPDLAISRAIEPVDNFHSKHIKDLLESRWNPKVPTRK